MSDWRCEHGDATLQLCDCAKLPSTFSKLPKPLEVGRMRVTQMPSRPSFGRTAIMPRSSVLEGAGGRWLGRSRLLRAPTPLIALATTLGVIVLLFTACGRSGPHEDK